MVIKLIKDGVSTELKRKEEAAPVTAAQIRINGKVAHTIGEDSTPAEIGGITISGQPSKEVIAPGGKKVEKTTPESMRSEKQQAEQLIIRQGELHNQKAKLANQLAQTAEQISVDERINLVQQIIDLKTQYNHNAEKLRYYELHGHFERKPVQEPARSLKGLDKHELLRHRQNCSANISKAKNMLRKHQHNPAKVNTYSNKLARLQAELQEIDEALSC